MPVAEALWVNLCCLNVLFAANKKKMGHKNNTKRLKKNVHNACLRLKKNFHFTKCDRCVAPGSAAEEGCP